MSYTIQEIKERLLLETDKIEYFIKINQLEVDNDGKVSETDFQLLADSSLQLPLFYSGKIIDIATDSKITVKQEPYFKSVDDRVLLFQDDAISFLKNLPDNSVDLITTDPAYSGMNQMLKLGKGKIIGEYKKAGKTGAKWFEEFHDTEENYQEFLRECHRVLKNNRHIYIMFDSFSLLSLAPVVRSVFDVKNILCWDKANIGLGHYFRRRHELILFASKGKKPLNSKSIPDVWKVKRVTKMSYPTQKPTEIFELMLKGSADEDYVVCDPFLGSGSAAIASLKHGCKFWGSDISEKSMSTSKNRVEKYLEKGVDPFQSQSLLGNDEAMLKLFKNG